MAISQILTDDAAQFSKPNVPGNRNLSILHSRLDLGMDAPVPISSMHLADFPQNVKMNLSPNHLLPEIEEVEAEIILHSQSTDDLFIILASGNLYPYYPLVESIINRLHGRSVIHLIDSQTISLGEGQIVQKALELIKLGLPGNEIEEYLREMVSHIYTLICTPNLSYLHKSGFIDSGQAVVGELLGFLPVFSIENGKLNPLDKLKNIRSVIDYFIEFLDEFDHLTDVSIIQPFHPYHNETKLVHQHLVEFFPGTNYAEHQISPFLASLIGPQGMGLVVTEKFSK